MAKTVEHKNNTAFFGSDKFLEKSMRTSYPAMLFELMSERKPSDGEIKLFELILNLTIDHGPDTPSAVPVIGAAKAGRTISEAVSSGVLKIDDIHGGAGEECMEIFYRIKSRKEKPENIVSEFVSNKKRIPGYGHRIYEVDPRTELIFKTMNELSAGSEFVSMAKNLEKELRKQTGKNLPLNVDGAIAAVLCSFGWEPRLAKALFVIARVPGLCGQYLNNSVSKGIHDKEN